MKTTRATGGNPGKPKPPAATTSVDSWGGSWAKSWAASWIRKIVRAWGKAWG